MRALIFKLFAIAALGMVLSGCHGDLVTKDVPGYPVFKASDIAVDFGRIAVQDVSEFTVSFRNIGSSDSELHLYYYLEGNEAFSFVFPNNEVVLKRADDPKYVPIEFAPEKGGEAEATLVVYHSDRPLADDINVTTYRISLSGYGVSTCKYPGVCLPENMIRPAPVTELGAGNLEPAN